MEAAERLLDLVIALTHTRRWMTKQDIRTRVNGYADAASDAAFERMFERDKDLLRDMGVPLIVEHDPAHEDDVGYRVDTSGYTLPPVAFTPAEVGVLSLAAEVWQDATLRSSARRGVTKLRAVGPAPDPAAQLGLALRVRGPEPAFAPILDAVNGRRVVTFTYRAASTGQVTRRTVQPWRLLSSGRGWYLVGHDVDRDAPRAFRLSRIAGQVRATGPTHAFDVPDEDVDISGLVEVASPRPGTARVAVLPGRAAALRARAEDVTGADATPDSEGPLADRDVLEVAYTDVELLAEEIAAYGASVLALDPPELRESVLRRLRAIALLDGGEAGRA